MSDEETTPIERLSVAIQTFINETSDDGPALLDTAVIVWETMTYDGDDVARAVNYANAGRFSQGASVGLLQIGHRLLLDDICDGAE